MNETVTEFDAYRGRLAQRRREVTILWAFLAIACVTLAGNMALLKPKSKPISLTDLSASQTTTHTVDSDKVVTTSKAGKPRISSAETIHQKTTTEDLEPSLAAETENLDQRARYYQAALNFEEQQKKWSSALWFDACLKSKLSWIILPVLFGLAIALGLRLKHPVRPNLDFLAGVEAAFAVWKEKLSSADKTAANHEDEWILHPPWAGLINAIATDPDFQTLYERNKSSATTQPPWDWLKDDKDFKPLVRLIAREQLDDKDLFGRFLHFFKNNKADAAKPPEGSLRAQLSNAVPSLLLLSVIGGTVVATRAVDASPPATTERNDTTDREEFEESLKRNLETLNQSIELLKTLFESEHPEAKPEQPAIITSDKQVERYFYNVPAQTDGVPNSQNIPPCISNCTHQDTKVVIPDFKVTLVGPVPDPAQHEKTRIPSEATAYFTRANLYDEVAIDSGICHKTLQLTLIFPVTNPTNPTQNNPKNPADTHWAPRRAKFHFTCDKEPQDNGGATPKDLFAAAYPTYNADLQADVWVESTSKKWWILPGRDTLVLHIKPRAQTAEPDPSTVDTHAPWLVATPE